MIRHGHCWVWLGQEASPSYARDVWRCSRCLTVSKVWHGSPTQWTVKRNRHAPVRCPMGRWRRKARALYYDPRSRGRRAGAAWPPRGGPVGTPSGSNRLRTAERRSVGSNPTPGRRPLVTIAAIFGTLALMWAIVIGGIWVIAWSATRGAFG